MEEVSKFIFDEILTDNRFVRSKDLFNNTRIKNFELNDSELDTILHKIRDRPNIETRNSGTNNEMYKVRKVVALEPFEDKEITNWFEKRGKKETPGFPSDPKISAMVISEVVSKFGVELD